MPSWLPHLRTAALLVITRAPARWRRDIAGRVARRPNLRRLCAVADGPRLIVAGVARGMSLAAGSPPIDHVHGHNILRGRLEISVQEALRRTVPEGGVVYDVGANVGFFSLIAARLVGPDGRVIAFEPVGESARLIDASMRLNGLVCAEIKQLALGSQAGRQALVVVDDPSWSHLGSRGRHPQQVRADTVEVAAIDELVARGLPPPDVVKIDVEGSEIEVLEGMRGVLAERGPVLICELHRTNNEIAELLRVHGYRCENLDGPEAIGQAGPNVHVLARPADR